ncbi:MAG: ABC transporter substrate-binding protein, partial [Dermatophilaceae bacterium]
CAASTVTGRRTDTHDEPLAATSGPDGPKATVNWRTLMASRTHKRLVAATLAAGLAVSLAACGRGSSGGGGDGSTVTLWTMHAGIEAELAAITQAANDYNASQSRYKVKVQSFPQDSYNTSVTSAASSQSLPCILNVDGPNVSNWAWAGYLAPLQGMDERAEKFLPAAQGRWNGSLYALGPYDVSLTFLARRSALQAAGVRIPDVEGPWSKAEFEDALKALKAKGGYQYAADFNTGFNGGEWWPYAYSPMLQSFGGDLIDRSDYQSADGVLNGPEAVAWARWFQGLIKDGYIPGTSGKDAQADFLNGKSAMVWNGSWGSQSALESDIAEDIVFLPPPDLGTGPKVGAASWQWAISTTCPASDGANEFMSMFMKDEYIAAQAEAAGTIPATDGAAAMVDGYEPGGVGDVFRGFAKAFAEPRPETPGYPFISTTFAKAAQDIVNGADPQKALDQAVREIDTNQRSNNFFK